ncbi:UNVERIFIED_CONTAM: hypothetical protein OHV15_19030, partial [Microbacterium sp. SLM126]
MRSLRESIRLRIARWVQPDVPPAIVTVEHTSDLTEQFRAAMLKGERGQRLAPIQYVTMSDPGPLFWGKLAV